MIASDRMMGVEMTDFTDQELLVHRFLDEELSAEERMAFVVRLGRDQSLRERVLDLEQLALDARRLPRPVVPEAFVQNVLDRLEPAPSAWRRLAEAFLAPRMLQWNLAGAAAVMCVAVVAVWVAVAAERSRAPELAVAQSGSAGSAAVPSPPVLVRLIVLQPGAMSVHVAGDFNGWSPSQTPLEPTADGRAWAVMLRLDPGRYEYQFVVDGERWLADPFAAEESDDGFGSRNAVLDVRLPVVAEHVS